MGTTEASKKNDQKYLRADSESPYRKIRLYPGEADILKDGRARANKKQPKVAVKARNVEWF
jgi:hypothetical protein